MIKIARLGMAASIAFAVATPAMSQDASRKAPGAEPATGAGETGGKADKQGDREDQGKSGMENNGDAPNAGPGGCPYIKRKLELIV
jgi:hypothetical protein